MILKQKLQVILHQDMAKEKLNKRFKTVLLFFSLLGEDMKVHTSAQDIEMATHQSRIVPNNPEMCRNRAERPVIRGKTEDALFHK